MVRSTRLGALVLLVLSLISVGCKGPARPLVRPVLVAPPPVSSSLKIIATIEVGPGPRSIVLDPVARRAYITCAWATGCVRVIDTRTETAANTIPVGLAPVDVALDPFAHRAYVVNDDISTDRWTLFNRNSVSVIDTRTCTVIKTLRVSRGPVQIAVDTAAHRAYVVSLGRQNSRGVSNGTVSVIDTVTDTVVKTFSIGADPADFALDTAAHRLYVVTGGHVAVISTVTDTAVCPPILVGGFPVGLAIDLAAHRAYVTDNEHNTIIWIDTGTDKVIGTLLVGDRPGSIALDPARHRAYVVNRGHLVPIPGVDDIGTHSVTRFIGRLSPGTLSILDTSQNPPKDIATVNVGTNPFRVAVDSISHRVYVTNGESATVQVIGEMSRWKKPTNLKMWRRGGTRTGRPGGSD